jgi:hypothetical protein
VKNAKSEHKGVIEQVEPWLLRAFMPGLKTLRPVAVAISLNSPGNIDFCSDRMSLERFTCGE